VASASLKENLEFLGTLYDSGVTLPFDVAATSYSATALKVLQLYWDMEFLTPLS
jgi:hypothetical protein